MSGVIPVPDEGNPDTPGRKAYPPRRGPACALGHPPTTLKEAPRAKPHSQKPRKHASQQKLSNCFVDKFYTATRIVKFITFFYVMNNPAKQLIAFIFLTNKWI